MAAKVQANASAILVRAALAVDQAVVTGMPVDTGRARANWLIGIGVQNRDVIGDEIRGPGSSAKRAALRANPIPASVALDQAKAATDTYEGKGSIWLSNNVQYIVPLNQGHSKLAPAGFIEMAIEAGSAAVRGSRVLP